MKPGQVGEGLISVRFLIAAALLLTALVALLLVLVATDAALSVWRELAAAPAWVRVGWLVLVIGVAGATTALAWRWLRPRKPAAKTAGEPLDEARLARDLEEASAAGVDVSKALEELAEARRRKQGGEVHIAIYGEVSTGKSALVGALLPEARPHSDPRAGTTQAVHHHRWQSGGGDVVVLADLPGFNLGEDERVLEEARRAHLVVFLCDGDLTRSQFAELDRLRELGKPVVLCLNKTDRYSAGELDAVAHRISERTGIARRDIVPVRTGGREEVVRLLSDGSERSELRERGPDVEALRRRIQDHLDRNLELIESLRNSAVLLLAAEKLQSARRSHLEEQSEALVRKYSRRAVIGALAAVAPGSDLVIQGVLATRLVQELCALHGVPAKEVEVDSFLKLAGGKLRKMSALTLAITGNALKAFPGMGTITGGLMHAVAYGMIFDSLGRAAAQTLASRGALRPIPAAAAFEEYLSENLASGARRFARLALSEARDRPAS